MAMAAAVIWLSPVTMTVRTAILRSSGDALADTRLEGPCRKARAMPTMSPLTLMASGVAPLATLSCDRLQRIRGRDSTETPGNVANHRAHRTLADDPAIGKVGYPLIAGLFSAEKIPNLWPEIEDSAVGHGKEAPREKTLLATTTEERPSGVVSK